MSAPLLVTGGASGIGARLVESLPRTPKGASFVTGQMIVVDGEAIRH